MTALAAKLLVAKQESPDSKSFFFDTQGRSIPYEAGQFLRLALPNVTDPRGAWRFFSFASSPTEKHVLIATKISQRAAPFKKGAAQSPFKQALTNVPVGTEILLTAPFGKFTLGDDINKRHIFLAGGIGITPFRSMLKFATDKRLPHRIILLYSNQTPQDIVFKEDLEQFQKENPNITIVYIITRPQLPDNNETIQQFNNNAYWKTGRIDEVMIKEYVKDLPNTLFYIAGPPSMVEDLYTMVKAMGVSEENIKTERFTGYQ